MVLKRDYYLNQLIAGRHNGLIKIVAGLSQRALMPFEILAWVIIRL